MLQRCGSEVSVRRRCSTADLVRSSVLRLDLGVAAGVCRDERCVDANQAFGDVSGENLLGEVPKQIAVPEAAMTVIGEGGVVGNGISQIKPAEPAIREVEMNIPLGPGSPRHARQDRRQR